MSPVSDTRKATDSPWPVEMGKTEDYCPHREC